jgi:cytochrome c oxidase subunit 4
MSGHISPKSTYYAIFGALMVLTAVTVGVAFINLGAFNFPVALAIAVTKATLVILFFMHVKYSSRLTKLFVGMAFFFLFILFGLTMTDYLSRGLRTYPGGAAGAGYAPPAPEGAREAPESGGGAEGAGQGTEAAPAH